MENAKLEEAIKNNIAIGITITELRMSRVYPTEPDSDIILTSRDNVSDISGSRNYIGSYNHPTIEGCIDEILEKMDSHYIDPLCIDWSKLPVSNTQCEEIIRQHQHIIDVQEALVAIQKVDPEVYFSPLDGPESLYDFCKTHSIDLRSATPKDIYEWIGISDVVAENWEMITS